MPVGYAPAWSPSGERIAFVTKSNLWVADADGTHRASSSATRMNRPGPERPPARVHAQGHVYTVRVDGLDERVLAEGAHPAWSPDGNADRVRPRRQIVTVALVRRRGADRTEGEDPALCPERPAGGGAERRGPRRRPDRRRGHLADLVARRAAGVRPRRRDLRRRQGGAQGPAAGVATAEARARAAAGLRPARADRPDDRRRAGPLAARLHLARRQHRHRPVRACRRPPSGTRANDRNAARAPSERKGAHVRQRRAVPLHELAAAPSLAPDAVRLVRAAHAGRRRLLVRDRKSGFCLADHWGAAPGRWPGRPAALPRRLRPVPSRGDARPDGNHSRLHRSLPGVLPRAEHRHHRRADRHLRADASRERVMQLRELRYDNDAASVRVRLSWRGGYPSVRVLRRCPATATC